MIKVDGLSDKFQKLLIKYDVPGPRYTSYPPVPFWGSEPIDQTNWLKDLSTSFLTSKLQGLGFGIYVHIPFCKQLCHFCGCYKYIRKNDSWNAPYIDAVLKEWDLYLTELSRLMNISQLPHIDEFHLGGGTPTFFSPDELKQLCEGVLLRAQSIGKNPCYSFEADPRTTTTEHLKTLFDLGFRRISLGVQDFNDEVQSAIHRHQSKEQVVRVVEDAKSLGFESINFDMVYGLPKQSLYSVIETVEQVINLRPDRIAFYSYAHVPWVAAAQRSFSDKDLPSGHNKRQFFDAGRKLFLSAGYDEIGMDHFALPSDSLSLAQKNRSLHRNFMGYVEKPLMPLLGLGVSSISESHKMYSQNIKEFSDYLKALEDGRLPLLRGYQLTENDQVIRKQILNLLTQYEFRLSDEFSKICSNSDLHKNLICLEKDGLLESVGGNYVLTTFGKCFVRNVAMSIDPRMTNTAGKNMFSRSI